MNTERWFTEAAQNFWLALSDSLLREARRGSLLEEAFVTLRRDGKLVAIAVPHVDMLLVGCQFFSRAMCVVSEYVWTCLRERLLEQQANDMTATAGVESSEAKIDQVSG